MLVKNYQFKACRAHAAILSAPASRLIPVGLTDCQRGLP
ncbi:hypothetical protein SAMN04487912_102442 [Arthrobacter sp. cf158]|nr:hypothetical protein SAMN04487912_102442 [Arthrobacter sp. cf158]